MCRVDNKYGPSSHLLEHLLDCLIDAHWAGGLNRRGARHISFNIGHVAILDCAKYCKANIQSQIKSDSICDVLIFAMDEDKHRFLL